MFNNVYFPEDSYYNTNDFPREWMEHFDDKESIVRRNMQEEAHFPIYQPNLEKDEMSKIFHTEFQQHNKKIQCKSKLKLLGLLSNPYKKKKEDYIRI